MNLQDGMRVEILIGVGYLAPLPYDYLHLRKDGKACRLCRFVMAS